MRKRICVSSFAYDPFLPLNLMYVRLLRVYSERLFKAITCQWSITEEVGHESKKVERVGQLISTSTFSSVITTNEKLVESLTLICISCCSHGGYQNCFIS